MSEVLGQVEARVHFGSLSAVLEDIVVNQSGESGKSGDQVHAVLVVGLPVFGFSDSASISLGEVRVSLH